MPNKLFKTISFIVIPLLLSARAFAGTTAPVTTLSKIPALPNGDNSWYTSPVTVTLTATDLESGVSEINYKIDNGNWIAKKFEDTLNLAPNPSFEITNINSNINTQDWNSTLTDSQTTYSRDYLIYMSDFETTSIKITSTGNDWHAINNSDSFAVSYPYNNMNASVWIKTDSVSTGAYFKIFSVSENELGIRSYKQIDESDVVSGTSEWVQLSKNFVVTTENTIGVYIEIGIEGSGTIWVDAVNINDSITSQETSFSISTDGQHTIYYYSTDRAGNIETTKSSNLKIDQTPPGNWHDSGAFRGFLGSAYQLWVYTNVQDTTSGLSTFSDKYQYHTELNSGFGQFNNILSCSSSWESTEWVILISPPFWPGSTSVYLLTPKTSFCNTNWNNPKIVRFYAKDMAGNESYKEFVINGPWIKLRGEGIVKSNEGIDMLSEAEGNNTDGLIEIATNQSDFFNSSNDWKIDFSLNAKEYTFNTLWDITNNKSLITDTLPTEDGNYYYDGDYVINNESLQENYSYESFSNVIFIDGNLKIETNITISDESAVLFVVNGDVEIDKLVEELDCGIFSEGNIYTAYNIEEGDATEALMLKGIFSANRFVFQRTLQGLDNNDIPSENFIYEPKYITKLSKYIGVNAVNWLSSD